MNLYFSGIRGVEQVQALRLAGVQRILADPMTLLGVVDNGRRVFGEVAADLQGNELGIGFTMKGLISSGLAWAVAGVREEDKEIDCLHHWQHQREAYPWVEVRPRWIWGQSDELLHRYLDNSDLVCVDGIQRSISHVHSITIRQGLYDLAIDFCTSQPGRFHILGLKNLHLLSALRDVVISCDTDRWAESARFGNIIKREDDRLRQVPAENAEIMADEQALAIINARVLRTEFEP